MSSKILRLLIAAILVGFVVTAVLFFNGKKLNTQADPLQLVIMDPLSQPLACECVAGYAQRKYEKLAGFLEKQMNRPVLLLYTESLATLTPQQRNETDVVIGKSSVVRYDGQKVQMKLTPMAMLSGLDGKITQTGLFVVRKDDRAQSIQDLETHSIILGPKDSDEKHSAAISTLDTFGISIPDSPVIHSSCNSASVAVVEKDADAAVISSYAMPLLAGCGTIEADSLRIVGQTDPIPFIGVFITQQMNSDQSRKLVESLLEVRNHPALLKAIESKNGFIHSGSAEQSSSSWTDWRGPSRDGVSSDVPATLPKIKQLLWSRVLTGHGMAGLAVQGKYLVVADKTLDENDDIFRCLDADSSRQIWKIQYPAAAQMDFTNSPRANPVIYKDRVYLLGAFGQLNCVNLEDGTIIWQRHLVEDFHTGVPTWGFCGVPLIVDDKLIINPGAKDASIAALDLDSGKTIWTTPGQPPGYSSFILASVNNTRQIIGYDLTSLGGWDPKTGRRLWQLTPEEEGDFNVPTPIFIDNKLMVSTENNGTRLYGFDSEGKIIKQPISQNEDLCPDTSTPIVYDGIALGSCYSLVCLDYENELKTLWEISDNPFADYASFIAGNGHVLIFTQSGELHLLKTTKKKPVFVAKLNLFEEEAPYNRDVWSHPALVSNRLYIRNSLAVYCFLLNE